jgi:hypothetical protein
MNIFVHSWQYPPALLALAGASCLAFIYGYRNKTRDAWLYIWASYFAATYLISNLFFVLWEISFVTLFLSQIAAALLIAASVLAVGAYVRLTRINLVSHSTPKAILMFLCLVIGALALAIIGANVPSRCSGARCGLLSTLFGSDLDFAKHYFVTSFGAMLLSAAVAALAGANVRRR